MIPTLIDKQDNFELIRDQIAAILVSEVASQMALAVTAGKDPNLWKLRVFTERSNPWEQWLNEQTDRSPIVNVWYDNSIFPLDSGNVFERQKSETIFNIDCYGYGMSADDPGGGHTPGDKDAALQAQRAVRLVRNILMAAQYTYLELRGLVWRRWPQSITAFQVAIDSREIQQINALRIAFQVDFNEFAPQFVPSRLCLLFIDVLRAEDGEILLEADYDFTLPFVSVWTTTNTGASANDQISLPLEASGAYDFKVDWGDASTSTIIAWDQAEVTHTYASSGTYTVTIRGTIEGWRFNGFFDSTDYDKIIEISSFGPLRLGDNGSYFQRCTQLVITATDVLDLIGTSDMTFAFLACSSIATIPSINLWDWLNVTILENIFTGMDVFDQNLNGMDVSNVTNFVGAFSSLDVFDNGGAALTWDTSSGILFNSMFSGSSFNRGLPWDVSNGEDFSTMFSSSLFNDPSIIDWVMSSALTIESMFKLAEFFNQPIGVWDVSSVTNFTSVFASFGGDPVAFNQNINAWDVSSGTTFSNMFSENKVYNQPVNNWTPSSAIFMNDMFRTNIKFNQPVSNLVGSTVTDINDITSGASDFSQDVSAWDVSNVTVISQLGDNTSMTRNQYDLLLNAWSLLSVQPGVTLDMGSIQFTTAVSGAARVILAGAPNNWIFVDGGGV